MRVDTYMEKYKMVKEKVDLEEVRVNNDEEEDAYEDVNIEMEEVEPVPATNSALDNFLRDISE